MKDKIRGIIQRLGLKKTFVLLTVSLIVAIFLIYCCIHELTRPLDLRSIDPDDYADNPELFKFAKGLVDTDKDTQYNVLLEMKELDYSAKIMNDKRYVDILILCLHEKETLPQKLMRFISIMKDYLSFSDLEWITDLWYELNYVFEEDEKAWIRDQALGYLGDLEEKAFPALPEIFRILKEDSQLDIKHTALYALELIKSPEAFPHIVSLIDDKEFTIEDIAVALAASTREKGQILTIASYLDSENERFRLLAIISILNLLPLDKDLSKKIYDKTRDMLVNDPSPDVRIYCVTLLNDLDDSDSTCELILAALEKEKNSSVLEALIIGLGYYENAAEYLLEVAKGPIESELQIAAISSLGTLINSNQKMQKEIQVCLVSLIKSPYTSETTRDECMQELAGSNNDVSEELVLIWLKNKYRKRIFTNLEISQLNRIRRKKTMDFMLEVINEQVKINQRFMEINDIVYLIRELGGFKSEKVNKNLKKLLKNSSYTDEEIQNALLEAIALNNDEEAVLTILNKLKQKDLDDYSKFQLLEKLKYCNSPAYMEYLAKYLNNRRDTYNFPSIFSRFNLEDERVYKEILKIVNDENIEVRLRCDAIEGLKRSAIPGAENEIERIMGDEKMPVLMRLRAADELKSVDEGKTLLFVAECLNDENLTVRTEALQSLWAYDEKVVLPILESRLKREKDYTLKNEIGNLAREIKENLRLEKAAEEERKEMEKELEKE